MCNYLLWVFFIKIKGYVKHYITKPNDSISVRKITGRSWANITIEIQYIEKFLKLKMKRSAFPK